MEHPNCGWKTVVTKVKDQLDLLEDSIVTGGMTAVALYKVLKKLIADEEQRISGSASASSSLSCTKTKSAHILPPLTCKKEESNKNVKKEKDRDSDSDSDVEIIEMENAQVNGGVETEKIHKNADADANVKSQSKKRTQNFHDPGEEPPKKVKSIHTQTATNAVSSTNSQSNSEQNPQANETQQEKIDKARENEPRVNEPKEEQEEDLSATSPLTHGENDKETEVNPQADQAEEQDQELGENEPKAEPEEDDEEKDSTADFPLTDGESESENDNDNDNEIENTNFFTPIYCPKVASSFWTSPTTAQKLAIHNYPQNLGDEGDLQYQSRFDKGLWFLVNSKDSKFTYYKLEELTLKLKSMKLPRLWLQLQISDFQNDQLQSFLSSFGKFVTHLTFERPVGNYEDEKITEAEFKSLLFEKLYNVEYLVVNENYISPSSSPVSSDKKEQAKVELPHLKTIQFINTKFTLSKCFIRPILKSSPKPEFIYNLPLKMFKLVKFLEKIPCVKSVESDHSESYDSKEAFEKDLEELSLSMSTIGLEKLVIPVYFNESDGDQTVVELNYQNFFDSESSRNSLREMQIEPTKLLNWSEFGKLENLSTLQINIFGFAPHYSNQLDINKIFPRVKTLIIDYFADTGKDKDGKNSSLAPQKFFEKYFPAKIFIPGKSFKSVRELKMMNSFPVECMQNIRVLLPGISTLSWNCKLAKFRQVLPLCWSLWSGLKTLKFEIDLTERRDDFEYADSALLGLPEKICEKLRNGKEIKNLDQFKNKPSILNLKKLERFEIEIQEPTVADSDAEAETRIFSQIVGSHGFAKMKQMNPKFQVQITLHSSCSSKYVQSVARNLQPLLPVVNL